MTTVEDGPVAATWVADDPALAALVDVLATQERYALDTEFHRERTYHPRLALLQFAWDGGIALVDPLAVDVKLLGILFDSDVLAVLHAAQQDLDVLTRSVGVVPRRLFDTQLAAGFLGYATPSLGNLLGGELGLRVAKGDRLTDWLRRPLTDDQRAYAVADVAHLLELHDLLVAQLVELGRLEWAATECELLRTRPTGPGDPDEAWLRLKEVRSLRGRGRGVARAVAAWRERRAASLDQPVRTVLPDLAILGLAQRPPRTIDELRQTRGIDDRHTRGAAAQDLLAAVQHGSANPVPDTADIDGDELDRSLRPAVTLVSAWVSQLARAQRIDTALLATRNDLVALLRGDADARLGQGWRAVMVGEDIKHLVAGESALAFDGKGNLRLLPVVAGGAEG
jgi:ribonuclease D